MPLTLVAGIGHWFLGSVDVHAFMSLIVGSVPGIVLGSYVALRLPETALRLVLAATLLVVAAKMSVSLFSAAPVDLVAVKSTAPH